MLVVLAELVGLYSWQYTVLADVFVVAFDMNTSHAESSQSAIEKAI